MGKVITKGYAKVFFLLLTFVIYSCSSIFSKYASIQDPLTKEYGIFVGCVLIALGLYAVLWQKVLSFMPLNKAFLCKSITIVMILAVSAFAFNEPISVNNIIGAIFIMTGLGVLAWKK